MFCNATPKRRLLSRVECFLSSSDPVTSGWQKPRRRENLTASDSVCAQPEYRVPVRKRADCKAEQYEITGSPSDVPAEVVLAGDASWWQQFPKRWTIVVLCFFSFLLCNMDRVS
jgi:ACS family sodium-dependent inorganic phosphate cotransporter